MENSPHWRAPNLILSSPIPPHNPGETFPELQLYRNPQSFEKRLLRGGSRGLDPDTGTRDLSGLHCAAPSSSDPETLFSSLLTLPASSSGSRNRIRKNPGRVGFPRRERRGWFSSSPRRLLHKPHSGLLRVPWSAHWLTHTPLDSKTATVSMHTSAPPVHTSVVFHPIACTHSLMPSHISQYILTHWVVASLSSIPRQLLVPRVPKP